MGVNAACIRAARKQVGLSDRVYVWGVEVWLYAFLTLAVGGNLQERSPGTHLIGGFLGPREGLNAL